MLTKLTKQQYDEIVKLVNIYRDQLPYWRKGQWLFNAINTVSPHLAEDIRGTEYDTFYSNDDDRYQKCCIYLASLIEE